jgi:glycosyltransferase involved in cell wall biosynthesis
VYNEAGNLMPLAAELAKAIAAQSDLAQVLWVDNGSTDESTEELGALTARYPWSRVLRLTENRGYGGGIRAGVSVAHGFSHIGWIPADGQVSVKDLFAVWGRCRQNPYEVHKGLRARRQDSASQRFVSFTYSWLVRRVLRLNVRDVNGLPKIFPARLLRAACEQPAASGFVFDAEMLFFAQNRRVEVNEHAVDWHARRSGSSSWSKKRVQTYVETLRSLLQLRTLRG